MPKGLRFPVKVNDRGGAQTIEGYFAINQNVILACWPAETSNPWLRKSVPNEDLIFDIRDNKSSGLYGMHVREFFAEMERAGFAKLLPGSHGIRIREPELEDEESDMIVEINYVNLESGDTESVSIPMAGAR